MSQPLKFFNDLLTLSPFIVPPIIGFFVANQLAIRGYAMKKVGIYSLSITFFSFLIFIIFATTGEDKLQTENSKIANAQNIPSTTADPAPPTEQNSTTTAVNYKNKLYELIGKPVSKASKILGHQPNSASNIVFSDGNLDFLYESYQGKISYVDIEFTDTTPCDQNVEFDSSAIISRLNLDIKKLELARKSTHFHTYYDHKNKLKVGVSCAYTGGPLSIGFSRRYYMQ